MRTRGMAKPRVDESRPRCRRVPSNPLEKQQLHAARRRGRQPGYHTGIGRTTEETLSARMETTECASPCDQDGPAVLLLFLFDFRCQIFFFSSFSFLGWVEEQSNFCLQGFDKSGRPYEETGAIAHT
jgi:hypothetical protein